MLRASACDTNVFTDASSKQRLLHQGQSPQRSLHSYKSNQSRRHQDAAADGARSPAEQLIQSESVIRELRLDYTRRDIEAKEAEARVASKT